MKENTALSILPEDCINKKAKETNVNIDGEICSLADLEKIFFLHKINPNPEFISSILKIDSSKIDSIVHSLQFQSIMNDYLSEYMNSSVGEHKEQLIMRYQDFLKEIFTTIRVSVGMRIRECLEEDKPLPEKFLYVGIIEKIMKLEFALRGIPVDLKGILHGKKKGSKDKSSEELLKSLEEIKVAVTDKKETFSPNSFMNQKEIEAEIIEEKELEEIEMEIDEEIKPKVSIDKE